MGVRKVRFDHTHNFQVCILNNSVLQDDREKVPVAQYIKDVMNWSCTEDSSQMVIILM